MKQQIISKINKLQETPDKQLEYLVKLFNDKALTAKELNEKRSLWTISGKTLNLLAVKVAQGKDGLEKDPIAARHLYEFAASRRSLRGKFNLAKSLLLHEPKDSEKAYELFTAMVPLHEEKKLVALKHTFNYYFGVSAYQIEQYGQSWRSFTQVPSYFIKNKKKIPNSFFDSAQEHLDVIKQFTLDTLKTSILYNEGTVIDFAEDSASENSDTETIEEAAQLRPIETLDACWTNLSSSLDIYDPMKAENSRDIILNFTKAKLEFEFARSNLELAEKMLDEADTNAEPDFVRVLFGKVFRQKRDDSNATKTTFQLTDKAYQTLFATGRKKQHRRQVQTEKHFFASERNHNIKVQEIATHLLHQRQRDKQEEASELLVTSIPVRRLIAAELAVIRASLKVMGTQPGYNSAAFPWTVGRKKSGQGHNGPYEQLYGLNESVKCGSAIITYHHRIDPHENHVGNFFMKNLGSYSEIYKRLCYFITDNKNQVVVEKEKQLAELMLRYVKTGTPVTIEELQQLQPKADLSDVKSIMKIFYHCFVKEPASWMIPREEDHEIPLATLQLRAVRLIAGGYLQIKDVFGQNSEHGVFTGEDIGSDIPKLLEKMQRINALYVKKFILSKGGDLALKFMQEHPKANPVETRALLHEELVENFGGESDTDDGGYDSDTAEQLYPSAYKF